MKTSTLTVLGSAGAGALALVFAVGLNNKPEPIPVVRTPATSLVAPEPVPHARTAHADSRNSSQRLLEIERALVSKDPFVRDAAFNVALPELLDSQPAWVIELVARQQGETRDVLRDEVVRLWIRKDQDAALLWMGTLESEERRAAATIAMRTLAAIEPAQAIAVADQFELGRDDGSLEHIAQIWATENPEAARKWLETQPDNARTAPLRARIEQAGEQQITAQE